MEGYFDERFSFFVGGVVVPDVVDCHHDGRFWWELCAGFAVYDGWAASGATVAELVVFEHGVFSLF